MKPSIRVLCVVVALAIGLAASPAASAAAPRCAGQSWVGAWATSPSDDLGARFTDQTLRLIVHPTLGGERLRVRLSNRFGDGPVTFGTASIGRRLAGAELVPGTIKRLRFGRRSSVTLPAGGEVASDPVKLRFKRFQDLAISLHVRGSSPPASEHLAAFQTSYSSPAGAGDHAWDRDGAAFSATVRSWPYLTDIEVRAPRRAGAVVAVGDSITDGVASTWDANRRWPDFLARRLAAAGRRLAVQNAGIAGNRVLLDSPPLGGPQGPRLFGPSLLDRLRRDVLDQRGATHAIVLEGTNDLSDAAPEAPATSAGAVIAGLKRTVKRLRAACIRPILATQTPSKDTSVGTHGSPEAVASRNAINAWIRTSGTPYVDFHAATRDPADPDQLLPAYNSGDNLHPNDAGMEAMADSVPLRLLRGPARGPEHRRRR